MNRLKTKKLALLTTVVLLVVCFLPVVQGTAPDRAVNVRHIDDWIFVGNPHGSSPGYLDPETWLIQRCTADSVFDAESFTGSIVERVRRDKSLHITVTIAVVGMPMAIRDYLTGLWIFVGVMDYTYTTQFILEKKIPGGPLLDWDFGDLVTDNKGELRPLIVPAYGEVPKGKREPGADLPAWWILLYYGNVIGAHYIMSDFISSATGNHIVPTATPLVPVLLQEGTVESHQQVIYSDNFDVDDPDVYQWTSWVVPEGVFREGGPLKQSPLLMPEMWPYEYITLSPMI